ncbi:ATP-dependent endonuclease [Flavitalea sp. BT771]|uniref:ATP-dependent nuclease n=1 Tax=Flavitalea sp. BT771 TaxID=3063329 RepID=UPI0026E430F3|nr:ATP-dependent endonuclease [Flavitalea sp. BT771]MDO6430898.1 ATP-dependent endonuclease [Flavitalea sp. BT771]MDV6218962.1 ATP-dependent endonuclease [Flavitalea sp. BT771]
MKIFKIQIENYRLLKDFAIDLEDELSLIIGKNNTGKTSILSVLEKFLNQSERNKFSFDDFNIVFKNSLKTLLTAPTDVAEADFVPMGITLKLFIEYTETDNLANVSRVMMDLDPDNNVIVLGFEYLLGFTEYKTLKADFKDFTAKENHKKTESPDYQILGVFDFLKEHHSKYFQPHRKSYEFDKGAKSINNSNYIDLIKEEISVKDIINFKFISARRDVTNKELDKTLSGQTSKIYKRTEANEEQTQAVEKFKDTLSNTDVSLSKIYSSLFADIVKKVKSFGGVRPNDSDIEIISTLQHRELLEGNTTVVYRHDSDNQLPENYNGLGYMNLISMIFEIEILVQEFKREMDKKPADINLLFIEEPEAHTHPQMQYVFIKNIKQLLKEGIVRSDGQSRNLQYIISTHSSHIVADSDFDDIKYLKRENNDGVIAKNLKDLQKEYNTETGQYQFLTQYLTISRAEIFFADKAILIEGDTERILIPTIMRKIDNDELARISAASETDQYLPLLSQNISIVEVGAYCHIFERFIDFIGIKSLLLTDLDAVDGAGKKCEVSAGTSYSNEALTFFFGSASLADLMGYVITNKCFKKVAGVWTSDANGSLCVAYQVAESGYTARSFEDAFININRSFITPIKDKFKGFQNRDLFDDTTNDAYKLASDCIKKKTHFALDIIFNSNSDFSNWQVPLYIKEGLLWLKQD